MKWAVASNGKELMIIHSQTEASFSTRKWNKYLFGKMRRLDRF